MLDDVMQIYFDQKREANMVKSENELIVNQKGVGSAHFDHY